MKHDVLGTIGELTQAHQRIARAERDVVRAAMRPYLDGHGIGSNIAKWSVACGKLCDARRYKTAVLRAMRKRVREAQQR